LIEQVLQAGFSYPFVVKPDVGMKGLWFERIDGPDQLIRYHKAVPVEYVIQEWVDWPIELSVFYYRHPEAPQGRITGFIHKTLLQVQGDGQSTLIELIRNHPKASGRIEELSRIHAYRFEEVIPAEEVYLLSYAANHNRDGMLQRFDAWSKHTSFYYGRYDLKVRSIDEFCSGGACSILEFNGCGAEPNHIYDCGMGLFEAYGVILQHWKALFSISRYNHQRGHRHWGFWKGLNFLCESGRHFQQLEAAQRPTL
jgi:hypothetical protein